MYNYCTLFDSNYLTRGLAMYESLRLHSDLFHLYIFAFDCESYDVLKKMNLESVTVISLLEFESEELLEVKKTRNPVEYCWTCTPSIIKYSIEIFNLDMCTYLDADLYFFENPALLVEEIGDLSVLITEHRYTKKYDQTESSGIYCVQFMPFKNDPFGMEALNWWVKSCNDWCYSYFEEGKFGDQKYLDDWTTRFKNVHVLNNIGGGVAPWNVQQYRISKLSVNKVVGIELLTNKKFVVIFYHFHALKFLKNGRVELGAYKLSKQSLDCLYRPYIVHLDKVERHLKLFDSGNYQNIVNERKNGIMKMLQALKRKFHGTHNVFKKSLFLK